MQINKTYMNCFSSQWIKKRTKKPTAIVIHHTCTKSPEKTKSALKCNGCSTHFEVDVDGTVYQYVDVMEIASHCGAPNVHSIGIDVTHLENAEFPKVQQKSVQELVSWLCSEWDIPQVVYLELEGIWPHCALGDTVCPNGFPMEILGEVVTQERDEVSLCKEMMEIGLSHGRVNELVEMAISHPEFMDALKKKGKL